MTGSPFPASMVGYFRDAAERAYDGGGEEVLRGLRHQSGGGILQGGLQARSRRQGEPEGRCGGPAGRRLLEKPGPDLPAGRRAGAQLELDRLKPVGLKPKSGFKLFEYSNFHGSRICPEEDSPDSVDST